MQLQAHVEHLRTPHKWGRPVLQGSGTPGQFDSWAVDCPFVFYHHDQFHMMYIGFDGSGYQTGLAVSDNLLDWTPKGIMLERLQAGSRWDHVGAAGSWLLLESDQLYEIPRLKKLNNKYWMIYHSYPEVGYEAGGAVMGLAWCEDEELLHWHRLDEPIFTYESGEHWELGGLYKCCVIEHNDQYYMFYNAKCTGEPWTEETGIATSTDLIHWTRHASNPVIAVQPDTYYSQFFSDPCVKFDRTLGKFINFGFGFDGRHAQGALAVSDEDLLHWSVYPEPWISHGSHGELDETHAHKSSVIYWQDTLYHFYCACRPAREGDRAVIYYGENNREFRCITVATSKPL
ncbi:glycoside hydrolase family protein [Paenibacillus albus]|uniref:Glycosyl hydrolase family 32 N-terminal domain-containing protein n=1 Tax=Paenibacillus albus TaxID=2495582 RepID=A0A3Q8X7X5_9BACL|nr:hypothetical protein [Paenibacillus albus]AZN42517.1 hypothetical protein EJC50_24650 [Paenibacillus albus]